jgi:hypothetical protein
MLLYLGIHITIANNPAVHISVLFDDFARRVRQHSVRPLTRVGVHVAQQALSGHGLRVHHVGDHRLPAPDNFEYIKSSNTNLCAGKKTQGKHRKQKGKQDKNGEA